MRLRLNQRIALTGLGLHSGKECELVIQPCDSPEIVMSDGAQSLPISQMLTTGTNRGSDYIFPDGSRIRTCEHVLSALYGLGLLSGIMLVIRGGEMPALDGCAEFLCSEIMSHSEQDTSEPEPEALELHEPVIVYPNDGNMTRFAAAFPCENEGETLHVTYTVEYKDVGCQILDYTHSPEKFCSEIARARTFAYESDIEYLRSHGMALGGSLDNAILITHEGTVKASGGLRFPDEFVRHKTLDLLGDLASLGKRLKAHIIALRAGHELHLKLAQHLKNLKGEKILNG